jgi:hypothetical protein
MTRSAARVFAGLLLYWCLLLSAPATAGVLSPKAKQHFDAGIAYFDDPSGHKYEEAYHEFKLAYADSPTYLLLANIGTCAIYLERDSEVIEAYEGYLAKATAKDISPKKRALMQSDIQRIKASIVHVTYITTPKTLMLTDERIPAKGQPILNRYAVTSGTLVLGIHPGHHLITATAEGYEPQTWDIDAESASTHNHVFDLKPIVKETTAPTPARVTRTTSKPRDATAAANSRQKSNKTILYVGGAVTGAFLIGAIVTGLTVQAKKSEFVDANRDGSQPDKARNLMREGKSYAILTDIGLGAAILTAGATALLYFSAPSSNSEASPPVARLRLEPTVGHASVGMSLSGMF